jgi:hypothetical protein
MPNAPFVGDASQCTWTLSANPSLTIMALADRLAQHLDEDPNNYLSTRAERVPGVGPRSEVHSRSIGVHAHPSASSATE